MSSDPLYEQVELALDKFQIEYAKAEHDQESYYAKDLSDALASTASAALLGLLLFCGNGLIFLDMISQFSLRPILPCIR